MSATAKTIREDIARAKAYIGRNDYLRSLDALARAVKGVAASQVFGREKFEVQALLEEAFRDLNGMAVVKKLFPKGLNYQRGKEAQLYKTLTRLAARLKDAMEKARIAKQREHLWKLDEMLLEAQKHMENENSLEARKLFRAASDTFTEIEGLNSDIGTRLMMGGLLQEAVEYLKRALEQNPSDNRAYGSLIMCYEGLGETAKAIETVKEAMRRLGVNESLEMRLAKLHLSRREWGEANKYAAAVVQKNPLNLEAEKIIKKTEPKIYGAGGKTSPGKSSGSGSGKAIKLDI